MASWSPSPSCKQRTARRGVARTTCPRAGDASRVLRSELSSDEAGRRMCPETCPQLGRYDPVQRPPTPISWLWESQKRPASTDLLIRRSQVRILAGASLCRAKYRLPDGRQVQTTIGPVWTERGRPPEGYFTRRERRRPGCDRGGRGVPPLPGRRSPAQAVDRPRRALGHPQSPAAAVRRAPARGHHRAGGRAVGAPARRRPPTVQRDEAQGHRHLPRRDGRERTGRVPVVAQTGAMSTAEAVECGDVDGVQMSGRRHSQTARELARALTDHALLPAALSPGG
jgi:hypothetical protein